MQFSLECPLPKVKNVRPVSNGDGSSYTGVPLLHKGDRQLVQLLDLALQNLTTRLHDDDVRGGGLTNRFETSQLLSRTYPKWRQIAAVSGGSVQAPACFDKKLICALNPFNNSRRRMTFCQN